MIARRALGLLIGLLLAGCGHSDPTAHKVAPIWDVSADNTLVHRPSGLTMQQQAGAFELTSSSYLGEWQDVRALYAAGRPERTVRVDFSGVGRPDDLGCSELLDRMASRQDQRGEFKERLQSWRTIAPLFPGMETGRAAIFAHRKPSGTGEPMQSEIYILCGQQWSVQFRADYPRGADGNAWIASLIAAMAPSGS